MSDATPKISRRTLRRTAPAALVVAAVLACSPGGASPAVAAAVAELTGQLASPDPALRVAAACALGELDEQAAAAIPALAGLLGDDRRVEGAPCNDSFTFGDGAEWIRVTSPA